MIDFLLTTPLEARQSTSYLIPIIIGIIFVVIVAGAGLLFAIIKKKREQLKLDPNRKTTKADINYVAKKMHLSQTEADFLAYLCKKNDIRNLSVTINDIKKIYQIFSIEHESSFSDYDEQMKEAFFKLLQKLDYQYNLENTITATKNMEEQTPVVFLYNGSGYSSKVNKITAEGVLFDIPINLEGEELNIKSMTKIVMKFSSKSSSIGYKVEVRFLRYDITKDGKKFLIAHSNNIETIHRRKERRIPFYDECRFRAVQINHFKTRDKKNNFSISEKEHKGRFKDISPSGCAILTSLPIKPKQYIYVEFPFPDGKKGKFIGIIVYNEFNKQDNEYILHIKFVKIDLKTKNNISEMYI